MATIGVKSIIPKGIGTVIWSWNYDEGQRQKKLIYFPDSRVNILSATSLDEFMEYDEVTWVLTKIKYSIFTWYSSKYKKAIATQKIVFRN